MSSLSHCACLFFDYFYAFETNPLVVHVNFFTLYSAHTYFVTDNSNWSCTVKSNISFGSDMRLCAAHMYAYVSHCMRESEKTSEPSLMLMCAYNMSISRKPSIAATNVLFPMCIRQTIDHKCRPMK